MSKKNSLDGYKLKRIYPRKSIKCTICLERASYKTKAVCKTSCHHIIQVTCAKRWFRLRDNCPLCRNDINKDFCGICKNKCVGNFTCRKCGDFCCLDCFVAKKKCPNC